MCLDKFKEIQKLVTSAKIATLKERYQKVVKDPSCDKYSLRFGGDSRFAVFSTTIFLDCHTGFYGNSNCSTFMSIDNLLAREALNAYLNSNMDDVLQGMADYMLERANQLKAEGQKELLDLQKVLDNL